MPKKSHSLYLGLATPGILHGIIVTKKAVTRLRVIFPFIKHVLIRLEKYQDLEKCRWEEYSHKPHEFTAKLVTGSVLAGNKKI